MSKIVFQEKEYPIEVKYKPIKKIYLRFKGGMFFVSAPETTNIKTINQLFENNQKTIERLLKIDNKIRQEIKDNITISLFGDNYKIILGLKTIIIDKTIYLNASNFKSEFIKLTNKMLYDYANSKLIFFHQQLYKNNNYPSLTIKSVDSKLGHYHKLKHQIMLSHNLVYNNTELIDYVIVHELVHIQEFNHQAGFYKLLETVLPNYRSLEKQLKHIGAVE